MPYQLRAACEFLAQVGSLQLQAVEDRENAAYRIKLEEVNQQLLTMAAKEGGLASLMVLERRVQAPEPDLQAITKNVTSASSLTKQATTDCINALEWIGSSDDRDVSLRSSVDEAIKLLALELSANGLELINGIENDSATAPQSFLRSVFMGALLAFCDQRSAGTALQVTFEAATHSHPGGRLQLRMLLDDIQKSPASLDIVRKYRMIGWADVQAMAKSFSVKLERGEGWLTLELPKS